MCHRSRSRHVYVQCLLEHMTWAYASSPNCMIRSLLLWCHLVMNWENIHSTDIAQPKKHRCKQDTNLWRWELLGESIENGWECYCLLQRVSDRANCCCFLVFHESSENECMFTISQALEKHFKTALVTEHKIKRCLPCYKSNINNISLRCIAYHVLFTAYSIWKQTQSFACSGYTTSRGHITWKTSFTVLVSIKNIWTVEYCKEIQVSLLLVKWSQILFYAMKILASKEYIG